MRSTFVGGWLLGLLLVAGLALVVYSSRYQIKETLAHRVRVAEARRESSHPVVAELADGTIRPGDPLDLLVARYPPTDTLAHGRYTTVCYVEGNRETYLLARDGRLVFARQCGNGVHGCTFFSILTPDEERDYAASYERTLTAKFNSRSRASMAVIGAAAAIHLEPPDPPANESR